jgi:hypothetical protein
MAGEDGDAGGRELDEGCRMRSETGLWCERSITTTTSSTHGSEPTHSLGAESRLQLGGAVACAGNAVLDGGREHGHAAHIADRVYACDEGSVCLRCSDSMRS